MELFNITTDEHGFKIEPGWLLIVLVLAYVVFILVKSRQLSSRLKFKSVTLKLPFETGEVELELDESERNAAWCLYVEMTTRIATQQIADDSGTDKAALDSFHSMYQKARDQLCTVTPKVYVPAYESFGGAVMFLLNGELRDFLSKWHPLVERPGGLTQDEHKRLREELRQVQKGLAPLVKGLEELFKVKR